MGHWEQGQKKEDCASVREILPRFQVQIDGGHVTVKMRRGGIGNRREKRRLGCRRIVNL